MSRQDIFAAADRLAAAGAKPTLKALRKELGGGSYRDLCPALRAWRETHENGAASVPQAVARRAREFGAQVWILAAGLAEERLNDRASAAEQSAAKHQGQLEQLRRQAELDARALREARAEASAARERAAQLQGQLDALRGQG